jgi:serine/threonine protein kinase
MGFMIKDSKEFQYLNMPKALLDPPSAQILSNKPENYQDLIKAGLYPFDHRDIFRDTPALARGSYGIVYKGKVKPFGERIVVIKDMFIRDSKSVIDWSRELETMQKSKSQYVAEVYGFTSIDNNLIIVMEYFPNGDLFNLLHKKKQPLDPLRRTIMARQTLCGLELLHSHSILHRDIKSMNILVTQNYDCKITDFGMSKLISDDIEVFNTANAGTPLWMAPEVKAGFYSFPADVYSMGLVLYEILELKLPPWDKSLDHIIFPEKYQFQQIIEPLIRNDSSQRLSAKDSLNYFDNQLVKVVVDNIRKAYPDIIKVDEELFDTARLLEYLEKELSSKNPNYDDLFLINKEN